MKKSTTEDHISHQTDMISTRYVGQGHQKVVHLGRDIGMRLLIGDTDMIVMLIGRIIVIMIN